jgi:hypothetical protein
LAGSEVTTKRGLAPLGQMLGLGDDAPRPAPAGQRAPEEVGEPARRAALGQTLPLGCGQLWSNGTNQALVAGEAEEVIDGVRFAPRHQLFAGKAGIGAQNDLHARPAGPDLADDARHLVDRAG